jgi:hypothetical protein
MHKQRNKRGKLSRKYFTQTIVEPREIQIPGQRFKSTNIKYPGHKTIIHGATIKP